MATCSRCGSHLDHAAGAMGEDDFAFVCPDCGNRETRSKFPEGVYLGKPTTPMGDPYAHGVDYDYQDHGRN